MALKETFGWVPPGMKTLPRENLLKLVAKTEATTYHPDDPNYPVRRFSAKELELAARTLIDRPVGRNHETEPIPNARVLDSEYSDKCVESIAYVPGDWAARVAKGEIKSCSVEYTWRSEKRDETVKPVAVEFEGLVFTRVDLVDGLTPGDKNSEVKLFEADKKIGHILMETSVLPVMKEKLTEIETKLLGEPFAGYTNFDDCVSKNASKENPQAYCAVIMRQAETHKAETLTLDNKNLREGFTRIQTELTTTKTEQDKRIANASIFAHEELKMAVESIIPRGGFVKDMRANRFILDVKKVLETPIGGQNEPNRKV